MPTGLWWRRRRRTLIAEFFFFFENGSFGDVKYEAEVEHLHVLKDHFVLCRVSTHETNYTYLANNALLLHQQLTLYGTQ